MGTQRKSFNTELLQASEVHTACHTYTTECTTLNYSKVLLMNWPLMKSPCHEKKVRRLLYTRSNISMFSQSCWTSSASAPHCTKLTLCSTVLRAAGSPRSDSHAEHTQLSASPTARLDTIQKSHYWNHLTAPINQSEEARKWIWLEPDQKGYSESFYTLRALILQSMKEEKRKKEKRGETVSFGCWSSLWHLTPSAMLSEQHLFLEVKFFVHNFQQIFNFIHFLSRHLLARAI